MDPDACLARILDHLDDGETDEARYAAQDLLDWCGKGGFPPDLSQLSKQHRTHVAVCFAFGVIAGDLVASR